MEEVTSLGHKLETMQELKEQLHRSVLLELLWPDVFKAGRATTQLIGSAREPHKAIFRVKTGHGNTRDFPIDRVHNDLLPHQFLMDVRSSHFIGAHPWLKKRGLKGYY